MTGELYELLTNHSVLRASVNSARPQLDLNAFDKGIHCAVEQSLSGALFQTRTRQVLQRKSPESNASFLSGVLIGAELHTLKIFNPLLIAGADTVRDLYTHAAKQLNLQAQTFSAEQVQLAVPRAHQLILSHLAAK
jgi:2-dehydro-3-deoxygalactonokinase